MDFKYGAFLIISAQIYSSLAASACTCHKDPQPVCGSDGVTYSNSCFLGCAAATSGKDIKIVKTGPCLESLCICPDVEAPVCGTDGQTYPNECILKCHSSRANKTLGVEHTGPCKVGCLCPEVFLPVCGNDGKTYGNDCKLACAARSSPKLELAHNGACVDSMSIADRRYTDGPPCVCTRNLAPVCGSNGETYRNQFVLQCAAYNSPQSQITRAKLGPCEGSLPLVVTSVCVRPYNYSPVCGSDGQTYPNECSLNCQKSRFNPSLKVESSGACKTAAQVVTLCPLNYSPVCGTDGVTYSNDCLLNVATQNNSGLGVAHSGACDNSVKVADI